MSLFKKAVAVDDYKQYLKEARGLERDFIDELVTSRRRAWWVASLAMFITLLSLLALMALTPLKTSVPFVLRVDNTTGHVDMVTTLKEQEVSYGDVVDSYFLNLYVMNRENYDYVTLQTLYETTALLSSPEVQRDYYRLFEGTQARNKVLNNTVKIVAVVRSITADPKHGTAVVRFSQQIQQSNGITQPKTYWVATIGYKYINARISLQDRRLNPLGFQITSYRLDPETLSYQRLK